MYLLVSVLLYDSVGIQSGDMRLKLTNIRNLFSAPKPILHIKNNSRIKNAFVFLVYFFFSHVNCIKHWWVSYV